MHIMPSFAASRKMNLIPFMCFGLMGLKVVSAHGLDLLLNSNFREMFMSNNRLPRCFCPDRLDPVCGDDGITYNSPCHADCAGMDFTFFGSCPIAVQLSRTHPTSTQIRCQCSRLPSPVCGEDGVTYRNRCVAQCFGVTRILEGRCSKTTTRSPGRVPVSTSAPTSTLSRVSRCGCNTLATDAVCGTNCREYRNRCEAECEGVQVLSQGPCSCEFR